MLRLNCRTGLVVFLVSLQGMSWAQMSQLNTQSDLSRAQVKGERNAQTEYFDGKVRNCESAFAVSECLTQVRLQRLAVLAVLNRHERQLNDSDRSQLAEQQLEISRRKQTEHTAKLIEQARGSNKPKGADQSIPTLVKSSGAKLVPRAEPSTQLSSAQRLQNSQDFQRKQDEAKERRKAAIARFKRNTKPAAPLPVPP